MSIHERDIAAAPPVDVGSDDERADRPVASNPADPSPSSTPRSRPDVDRPASQLDDDADRQELHDRYYGLLQELRVLLPGVQILVAFLFTVPFADGFGQLDEAGRDLYGIALVSGILAIIAFTTPTAFHRVGARRSRSARLEWGIRATRAGLVLFAISLISALTVVVRVVLSLPLAVAAVGVVVVALLAMWVALPLVTSRRHRD